AIPHYQKAISIRPDLAVAHSNLGTALRVTGRLEEALAHYRQAVSLRPGFATAHNNLAALYERTNQLALAEESNSRALAINPDDADSHFVQALLLRRRGDTGEAIAVLEALDGEALSENYRTRRYFELGKLLDAEGESEKAFKAYNRGNLLHSRSAAAAMVNKDHYRSKIHAMQSALSTEWVNSWSPHAGQCNEATPIFIVGFPRSGTTLLDQILDSHPRIQVMEERPVFASVERALQTMPGGYPGALQGLTETDITSLRKLYFDVVDQRFTRSPAHFFVDKRPINTEYVPLIQRLFPGARIIFACRHPCDVVLSNFMQYYNLNDAMANFFSLEDTVHLYRQVMTLWLDCTELLDLNFHAVRYESLVSDIDAELHKLFTFLEVDWDERVLDFHRHAGEKDIINTPSYEHVTQPIYARATDRWHRYRRHFEPFLQDLEPFIQRLGYAERA
ncbi:MAG: sulfotransferase, partial [Gammaproteobacteria bacterium]|nr:sulfotransferase [Gammaproteobacteria bacterium]